MPKIVDASKKRQGILAAAAAIFARHGYRGTNLQRVAAAAGMGKSSLYHYFPTKEALFNALADHLFRHEAELFDALAASPRPAAERLRTLVDAIAAMLDEWSKTGPLLLDFLREPRGRRRVRETFRTARAALARLIKDGQRAGQFRPEAAPALATIVLGCLDGLFLQEMVEPGATGAVANTTILREVLLAALRPEPSR
ncbi:MAG: TetR/AcrR family transcriptional regulator [Candidatus Binatia bacterium]